jgi:hypothetical protein
VQTDPHLDYYSKRAAEERLAADRATDRRAAQAHSELARRFEDMAHGMPSNVVPLNPAARQPGLSNELKILP